MFALMSGKEHMFILRFGYAYVLYNQSFPSMFPLPWGALSLARPRRYFFQTYVLTPMYNSSRFGHLKHLRESKKQETTQRAPAVLEKEYPPTADLRSFGNAAVFYSIPAYMNEGKSEYFCATVRFNDLHAGAFSTTVHSNNQYAVWNSIRDYHVPQEFINGATELKISAIYMGSFTSPSGTPLHVTYILKTEGLTPAIAPVKRANIHPFLKYAGYNYHNDRAELPKPPVELDPIKTNGIARDEFLQSKYEELAVEQQTKMQNLIREIPPNTNNWRGLRRRRPTPKPRGESVANDFGRRESDEPRAPNRRVFARLDADPALARFARLETTPAPPTETPARPPPFTESLPRVAPSTTQERIAEEKSTHSIIREIVGSERLRLEKTGEPDEDSSAVSSEP